MWTRTTITDDNVMIVTNHLTERLHNIVVDIIENNCESYGHYYLSEEDDDSIEDLIDMFEGMPREDINESKDDVEFAKMLRKALDCNSDVYSLCNEIGDFSQPLGTVIVFWQPDESELK